MNILEYLRQFRISHFAVFDFTASFIGMLLISPVLSSIAAKFGLYVPKRNWVFFTIPLSIIAHILAGTMTPLTQFVLDASGHYFEKIIVLVFCVLSILGIKKIKKSHA